MAIHLHHRQCIPLFCLIMGTISQMHNNHLTQHLTLSFILHPQCSHKDINKLLIWYLIILSYRLHLRFHHFNNCIQDTIKKEDAFEKEINIINEVEKAVIHLVRARVLHKNHAISPRVKNVDGRVNKRTSLLVLKNLKNTKDKYTKITPKR